MRAIYVLLLSTSVAASTINGTLPAQSSTSALASTWPTVPSIGFSSSDDSLIETKSYVTGFSYAEGATSGIYTRTVQCTSVDDVACASSDSIFAQLILPPCSAPSVATVSGKRIGDDYLIVSAGFHYSSPTLRVKLAQSKATEPLKSEPVAEPIKSAPVKKIKITCKKGKVTKQVTAVKPTCPSGYKKV